MITLLKRQWFVIGLSAAVLLAFKIPEWGASGGKLQSDVASEIGIILVFLFQGWMLPNRILHCRVPGKCRDHYKNMSGYV